MMKRTFVCAALLAAAACQVDNKDAKQKLDDILVKLDQIDKKSSKLTDRFIAEIDKTLAAKEADLLAV